MSEKKKTTSPEPLTFEQAMKRLEDIVRQMESGDLPLEKMVEAYEEGRRLLEFCSGKLNEVEKKIELLEKNGDEWTAREVSETELRAPSDAP